MASTSVYVIGVGLTRFERPQTKKWDYPDMARISGTDALKDAGIGYGEVEAVVASYCYGEPTCGQRAVYELGLTGVPVFNVNNNCSSGSSALMLARHLIQSGHYSVVMAIGFEKMERGLSERYNDRVSPVSRHFDRITQLGVSSELLPADGSGCAILCSKDYLNRHPPQEKRSVCILSQHMTTDLPQNFSDEGGFAALSGYDMAKTAAQKCYKESGLSAEDMDVIEVHDCFAPNELFMYEALGLAEEGEGATLFRQGKWEQNKSGGKVYRMKRWVVNPSGGLETKGHPIGATGIAQCHEIVSQLRGEAGKRQVLGAKRGLQHNFGIGGACVVTMYEKSDVNTAKL